MWKFFSRKKRSAAGEDAGPATDLREKFHLETVSLSRGCAPEVGLPPRLAGELEEP